MEVAAQRLADPGFAHVAIGVLAYGCGFSNQSHFSRRFKERYELAPSDYRWRALSLKSDENLLLERPAACLKACHGSVEERPLYQPIHLKSDRRFRPAAATHRPPRRLRWVGKLTVRFRVGHWLRTDMSATLVRNATQTVQALPVHFAHHTAENMRPNHTSHSSKDRLYIFKSK